MATRTFKNMAELEKGLNLYIKTWLEEMRKKLDDYLQEFIESEFYDQYQPTKLYKREKRIFEAIIVTEVQPIKNGYQIILYLDPSRVSYDPTPWYNTKTKSWGFIQGDDSETVFSLMSNGIHGEIANGQTDGRFWEAFLKEIGHGGVYDIFTDFKRFLIGKGLNVIS